MKRQFDRTGTLAIKCSALALSYDSQSKPEACFDTVGSIAVVDVCGPLMHHPEPWFDSYESVVERVKAALSSSAQAVVMRIDSPGGLVAGCFDACREIKALATAQQKPLIAFVDEQATSAAYALATAADRIVMPETGEVGSIGVIETLTDLSAQLAAMGVNVTVIASGARKSDGRPEIPLSEDAKAAIQVHVDRLAESFFDLCSEHRGLPPEHFAGLEAGCYYGKDALVQRLADEIMSYPTLLAKLESGSYTKPKDPKSMTLAEIQAGLKALAEGDGDDAEAAKKMLSALEAKAEEAPAEDEEKKDEEKEEPAAEMPKDEDKEKMAALTAENARLKAEHETARDALLASRPDLSAELVDTLKALPLAVCHKVVSSIKPKAAPKAAALSVSGTPGAGQGGTVVNADAARAIASLTPEQLKLCSDNGVKPEDFAAAAGLIRS